jgi:tetratricopeptide (TPR) repeat protein
LIALLEFWRTFTNGVVLLLICTFSVFGQVNRWTPEKVEQQIKAAKELGSFDLTIASLEALQNETAIQEDAHLKATVLCAIAQRYLENRRNQEVIVRQQACINHLKQHQLNEKYPLALHNFAKAYQLIGKIDSSLLYYELANQEIRDNDSLYRHNLKELGDILSEVGQPELGLQKSLEALSLMEAANDESGAAFVYGTIGKTYQKLGKIPEGLAAFQKSKDFYLQAGHYEKVVVICINIGALYGNNNRLDDAEIYFRKAIDYSKFIPLKPFLGDIYYNLFVIARNKQDNDSALYFLDRSTQIFQQFDYQAKVSRNKTAATSLLVEAERYEEAKFILMDNYRTAIETGNKYHLTLISNSLGSLYRKQDSLDKAIEMYQESLEYSLESKELKHIATNYKGLFYSYLDKGNKERALEYFKLYEIHRDSTINEDHSNALARLKTEFETEKKNREIAELNRENTEKALLLEGQAYALEIYQLQTLEKEQALSLLESQSALLALEHENTNMLLSKANLENSHYEQSLQLTTSKIALQDLMLVKERTQKMSIAAIGILLIGFLIWFTYTLIERRRIQEAHALSELENKLLRSQMKPHFVFNALQSVNKFILNNQNTMASDFLTRFSIVIRSFLHNSIKDEVTLQAELETVRSYLDIEQELLKGKFEYSISVDKDLDLENILIPPLLLQPFLENAIWHGIAPKEGQGQILLEVKHKDNNLQIAITDDGVGRQKSTAVISRSMGHQESLGIKLTNKRLSLLCKGRVMAPLEFQELKQGLRVRLSIPFKEAF